MGTNESRVGLGVWDFSGHVCVKQSNKLHVSRTLLLVGGWLVGWLVGSFID
jgi:hypothetical protein